ncbi:MAG TPA: SCP2 sterol-binding domain-containing protein [Myxococcota bacterium]|nr:SCP2 sterol-binding domain-containing protein [Myxococcota bacterium]HRY92427.1 SCP2 sterol-binding domain-containing protein [Myxococcota bacterium]
MRALIDKLGISRLLPAQDCTADCVLANMHLHAVLPRLADLVRLDPEARALAEKLSLSLDFSVLGGPAAHLRFSGGQVQHGAGRQGFPALGLVFTSCARLNRMFGGEKVTPIPVGGLHQLLKVKQFEALTGILTRYLKPSEDALADPRFKAAHVELSLLTGLGAACQVGHCDPAARRVMAALHDGTIQFQVKGGPSAYVRIAREELSVAAGEVERPTATLVLRDLDFAASLIRGEVDAFSAVGAGDIRMHGDLFLADEFNALFDRVGLFLH